MPLFRLLPERVQAHEDPVFEIKLSSNEDCNVQAYDLIMLIVIGMATIFGAIKGFAWQVASLASILVSYGVAYRFRFDVAEMIQAKPPWNQFLAMLILYVGSSFVIWVGFRLLSSTIDRVRLKEFDRHLGAAFGFAKGLVYCLLITMFATSLLGPNQQAAICHSRSGYYIAKALDNGIGILPKEIHDVVGPYLARLDDKLKNGGAFDNAAVETTDLGWPTTGGLPGLENIPAGIQSSLQNGLRDAMPQLLPAAGNTTIPAIPGNWPADWNSDIVPGNLPNLDPRNVDPRSLDAASLFPQATTNSAPPQIYPPLPNHQSISQPGTQPGINGGLRPAGSLQQAQQPVPQPGYVLPR